MKKMQERTSARPTTLATCEGEGVREEGREREGGREEGGGGGGGGGERERTSIILCEIL